MASVDDKLKQKNGLSFPLMDFFDLNLNKLNDGTEFFGFNCKPDSANTNIEVIVTGSAFFFVFLNGNTFVDVYGADGRTAGDLIFTDTTFILGQFPFSSVAGGFQSRAVDKRGVTQSVSIDSASGNEFSMQMDADQTANEPFKFWVASPASDKRDTVIIPQGNDEANAEFRFLRDGGTTVPNIPTSDPVNAGQLWNDSGTMKISTG